MASQSNWQLEFISKEVYFTVMEMITRDVFFCSQCIFCPRTESTSETLCIWTVIAELSCHSKKVFFYKWKTSPAIYPFNPFIKFVSTTVRGFLLLVWGIFCIEDLFSGIGVI